MKQKPRKQVKGNFVKDPKTGLLLPATGFYIMQKRVKGKKVRKK